MLRRWCFAAATSACLFAAHGEAWAQGAGGGAGSGPSSGAAVGAGAAVPGSPAAIISPGSQAGSSAGKEPQPPVEPAPPPPPAKPQPPAKPGRGAWRAFRAGSNLVSSIPTAAVLDGVWSLSLQSATQFVNRTWSPPFPWGSIGHYWTHILYGTSWTLMLGLESLIVVLASGGKLDWMAEASYRVDWILGYDLPACPRPGAMGGCGIGAGDFAYLSVRPLRSKWWYEAGGGWFQQRVSNDELRTIGESTWVLMPFAAMREFSTDLEQDVAVRTFVGPAAFGGMHSVNFHPTQKGTELYDVPWSELYPLDGGIGPGLRAEGRLIAWQKWGVEGELIFAPFLLGGPVRQVSHDVSPLDYPRHGFSVWRKATLGLSWFDPKILPFKTTLAFFAAELSDRPVEKMGYRGAMFRFDIPLKVPSD